MKWISLIALLLLFASCNKRSTTEFTVMGQINHYTTGSGLDGVTILVYENTSSGMNVGQSLIGTTSSNSDGSYSIVFPRNLVESYTIRFYKEGYFLEEVFLNFSDLHTDEDNIININQRPIGWIRFVIENVAPTDPQDQLKIYKESGTTNCADCCPDGYYYYDGANINTTMTCPNVAGEYFVFRIWDVLQPSYTFDSVLIVQNDTIDYVVHY
ncbi:MAG: hypothetical protein KDC84_11125 [Crocinitomicaceae bacterium]|nr:hypothetical protein [Crocinitomicaceae bacterium]